MNEPASEMAPADLAGGERFFHPVFAIDPSLLVNSRPRRAAELYVQAALLTVLVRRRATRYLPALARHCM